MTQKTLTIGGGVALLVVVLAFVPWLPPVATGFYEYYQHVAWEEGQRWGSDLIATYGPLGFVGLPFYRAKTYPLMLAFQLLALAGAIVALRRLWQWRDGPAAATFWWIAAVLGVLCLCPVQEWSPLLSLPYLLVALVVGLRLTARPVSILFEGALFAALGVFVWVKGIFLPLGLVLALVTTVDDLVWRHRRPLTLVVFISSTLLTWLVAGQRLGDLPLYLHGWVEVTRGYGDAMQVEMPKERWWWAYAFVGATLCFLVTWWRSANPSGWLRKALLLTPIAFACQTIFLHGFTRAGHGHTLAAFVTLCSLSLFSLPWRWSRGERKLAQLPRLGLLVGFAGFGLMLAEPDMRPGLTLPAGRLTSFFSFITAGRSSSEQEESRRLQAAQGERFAPGTTVDMPTDDPDFLLAQNVFRPRPTRVAYQSYTPYLAKANQRFLESSAGPSLVLFSPPAIDGVYPTLIDNYSFLSLASHFSPRGWYRGHLVLERRSVPQAFAFAPLATVETRAGEVIRVPDSSGMPIWAALTVEKTLLGRLLGLVYKPPRLFLQVAAGGAIRQHRVVFEMLREGFLLSPYLSQMSDFAQFYGAPGKRLDGLAPVATLQILFDPASSLAPLYYESTLKAAFSAIHFAGEP